MFDSTQLVDARGRYIGCVVFLQRDGDKVLYGWTVSPPGNTIRSETGRADSEEQAIADAVRQAGLFGIEGACVKPDRHEMH